MALNGLIFDRRNNTAKNWRSILAEIMGDGIIGSGCEVTSTSNSITVGGGHFILKGAVIENNGADTIPVTPTLTDGYVRLICRIDLTQEASETGPGQVGWVTDFSATPTFPALTQEDINGTGSVYEGEIAVLQIVSGNITGITRQIGAAEIDAEKLGGKAAVLYALAADVLKNSGAQVLDGSLDASGSIIAPNFRIDIADGSMWLTGGSRRFRIHYDSGNNLYFHVYNADGTSIVATPLYISAAGEVVAPTINATGALKSQGTYNRTTTAAANTHISDSASGHHLYRSTSSQRWKTNINAADLEEIRKVLLKILVVNFTSLCECDDPDKVHTGFIAEQLAEIDRRMATYGTDDDGNEQVEGFDSNELISRTVAGWQIHEIEINGIKAKAAKFDALSALLVSKGILTQEEIDGLGDKA
jgi:hypothetical protein